MKPIQPAPLPERALLNRYQSGNAYTDCYATTIDGTYSHAEYVRAFYCTWLFKTERWILKLLLRRGATDKQAEQLAYAQIDQFAAWRVEARDENQLLLCDFGGRTRSWLMTEEVAVADSEAPQTRLYFGSAVVHPKSGDGASVRPGWIFRALLDFHKLYSVALLRCARGAMLKRIQRS